MSAGMRFVFVSAGLHRCTNLVEWSQGTARGGACSPYSEVALQRNRIDQPRALLVYCQHRYVICGRADGGKHLISPVGQ